MKKAIAILVLGLLWCNPSFADILLKNCGSIREDGTFVKLQGINDGARDEYYINFQEGYVIYTRVKSESEYKSDKFIEEEFRKQGNYDWPAAVRSLNIVYTMTFADEKIVTGKSKLGAEHILPGAIEELYIKLDENIVEINKIAVTEEAKLATQIATSGITGIESFGKYTYKCEQEKSQEPGSSGSSGTAFFINNRGNLLTNNHVVEGCQSQKINYFNKEYEVKIIATDKTLDLALLKANVRPKSFISFSKDEPKKRQTITAAGYPLGQFLSDDLKINDGRISALKGFENNSNEIQHDIPVNPGNSGGPIVNEKGQLVAITVSGMAKDITEGLNFGIKASAAANFLKSNKISPSTGYMSFSTSGDKLVKLLEESTVYTFCE